MPLGYVISTAIMKWFVFIISFIKLVETLLNFSNLEAIGPEHAKIQVEYSVRQWMGNRILGNGQSPETL
jgi:hypothetical protein